MATILVSWLVFSLSAVSAEEISSQERTATLKWFSTLGYPDVENKAFVRVFTARWKQAANEPAKNSYVYGFVIESDEDSLTVFSLDRQRLKFKKPVADTPANMRTEVKELKLVEHVEQFLRDPRETRDQEQFRLSRLGRVSKRAQLFTLAWACWRKGDDELAEQLCDLANDVPPPRVEPKLSLKQLLANDLAHEEMWSGIVDFGKQSVPRTALVTRFERLIANFPESEHVPRAKETLAILQQMVKEDVEHEEARKKEPPLGKLATKDKVAELIFQLRDQHGGQFGLDATAEQNTPARQLRDIGYDAVPQLIEALDDKRFTRWVTSHRDFYFSHRVHTIGEASEDILRYTAGRSFRETPDASDDGGETRQPPSPKEQAKAWYVDLQKKGEKQSLLDGVARGDENSDWQAMKLVEKYARDEATIPALAKGIRASEEDVRVKLIYQLGSISNEAVVDILLEELKRPGRVGRLSAAKELHKRKRPEGVAAMIRLWEDSSSILNSERDPFNRYGGRMDVAEFLAQSGDSKAIAALHKSFAKEPLENRVQILKHFDKRAFAAASEDVQPVIIAFFGLALDDTEQWKANGSINNKRFSSPRVCDLAGQSLNTIDPKRFPFDLEAPLEDREKSRMELKKIIERITAKKAR